MSAQAPPPASLIGPLIPNGDGSPSYNYQIVVSPSDHYTNGNIYMDPTTKKYYLRNIVETPFGPSQWWTLVTVVGPGII